MTLPFFIIGLVLELAGRGWFTGAGTVGWILMICGVVGFLFQIVVMVVFGAMTSALKGAVRRLPR